MHHTLATLAAAHPCCAPASIYECDCHTLVGVETCSCGGDFVVELCVCDHEERALRGLAAMPADVEIMIDAKARILEIASACREIELPPLETRTWPGIAKAILSAWLEECRDRGQI